MKIFLSLLLSFFIYHSLCAQWEVIHTGGYSIYDIEFINKNTGWFVNGASTIYKTEDGGLNWHSQFQESINSASVFLGLHFLNEKFGWVSGVHYTITGMIGKTTDGGENWDILFPGVDGALDDIWFLNPDTGFSCGTLGIVRTTDGGNNWEIKRPTSGRFIHIQFFDETIGYAVSLEGEVVRTEDVGNNWNVVSENLGWLYGGYFFDEVAWVVGSNGIIKKSINAGVTWFDQVSGTDKTLQAAHFINPSTGWICGDGIILHTKDGGNNWIKQYESQITQEILSIFFIDENFGMAIGRNAIILRTTNGGGSGINTIKNRAVNNMPKSIILHQNFPNPFNPITTIKYSLEKSGIVDLSLFDVTGQKVTTLYSGKQLKGEHEVIFDGSNLPSGVYYYQLNSKNAIEIKICILMK